MRIPPKILAEFYYQFGTMIQAGVSISHALATLTRTGPRPLRPAVTALGESIQQGNPLHEAMNFRPDLFSAMDRQTISVSERSGALDTGLLSLARYHEARGKARRAITSASMFPAVLLVAAVFIGHFPQLLLGQLGQTPYRITDYLVDTVGFLVMLIVVTSVLYWWFRRLLRTPGVDVKIDKALRSIPVVGRLRFDYALSQWISSIRLMLNAGFGIHEALEYASETTGSPLIAHAYEQARPLIHGQTDVSTALQSTGVFPEVVIQFWATGEQSGRMDDMLERLALQAEERWQESLRHLSAWLPRIGYALVSVYIIYQIFQLLMPTIEIYRDLLQ